VDERRVRYEIEWSEDAKADVRRLRAFYRPPILAAVAELTHQAESEARNRKPLRPGEDVPLGYPDPTWEIRVRGHRVFYFVGAGTARILGVRLKGLLTTGEIL
jgi:mRNA-degrading endonuclease RelE of RelBE toxin-antitoxin system